MKTKHFRKSLTAIVCLLTIAISGNAKQMTMTTSKEIVRVRLYGTGTATIDWGDGEAVETVELVSTEEEVRVRRAYSEEKQRTITINGDNITGLISRGNQLTKLDVSKNPALTLLYCSRNNLTELDVSKNSKLTELRCYDNQLSALNVNKNTKLTLLYCGNNQLTELNVSKNTLLIQLYCWDNQLAKLDVSKNTQLLQLYCWNNKLTELNVSRNTALTELWCHKNQLTTLNLSNNIAMTDVDCSENKFTAEGLNALFKGLPKNNSYSFISEDEGYEYIRTKTIDISENPGTADCDPSAAEAKGWTVKGAL